MLFGRFLQISFIVVLLLAGSIERSFAQSAFEDPGSAGAGNTSGDLTTVSSSVDAGEVTLGSSSQVVLLFRNDGIKPIKTGIINLYPSSNVSAQVTENQCAPKSTQDKGLEPGAICAIAFSVKGLQTGNFRVEVLMRHDGRAKLITATISGNVASSGDGADELVSDIETIPAELDFGSLSASRSLVRSIILRNITSKAIDIKSIDIESSGQSGFSIKSTCSKLDTGEACIVTVTWAPEQTGPATGVLVVNHSGPTGIASVTLDGEYSPDAASEAEVFPDAVPGKGLLTASQSEIDFGSISNSSAITVSLVNVGDAPLIINDIFLSNDESGIKIAQEGCVPGTLLEPIEACPMTLTWEPLREGDVIDDIQVLHNGARGILVLPLRGSATEVVNKDSQAVVLSSPTQNFLRAVPPIFDQELDIDSEEDDEFEEQSSSTRQVVSVPTPPPAPIVPEVNLKAALDGFVVTSHAPRRAIISGPGGSRVVFDNEQTVIGGVLWTVGIRPSAVEFAHGDQKVLLLFDKSLSSVNRVSGQSESDETDEN